MKLTYTTREGDRISGRDAREVIEALRAGAWMRRESLADYIEKTAYFAELQTGLPVRGDTAENLLADLIEAGLLTLEGAC